MFWIGNLLWVALDGDEARGDDARFLPRLLGVEEAEEPKELEEDEEELVAEEGEAEGAPGSADGCAEAGGAAEAESWAGEH